MKFLGMTLLGLMATVTTMAQQVATGRVLDATTNAPLVGATVIESGTSNGTIADRDGNFSLTTAEGAKLLINYVGYISRLVPVGSNLTVLMDSDYQLEDIIIEAVRANDEPVSYSDVDRKEIVEAYNGEQPIFLLEELTPSIYTYSESGTRLANYGNLRLRGIDQQRINMTLNGVPLNDMIDHGVFFSNFTDIGNSIESVQVQRGVGTSSNGVASYAGSINFESINLRNSEAGGTIEMGLGSFDTKRYNASATTGLIDDKWAAYASFSRLYSDGYRRNTSTDAYSFFLSAGYFGERDFIKINAFDANAVNGLGYSAVLESDLKADPKTNYLNENDTDNFGQQLVQLQHTHMFSNLFSVTSSLYYGAAGGDFFYSYPDSDTTLAQINYPLFNDHYGVMSNLIYTPSTDLEISGGLHAYVFKRQNIESITPDFKNPYYDETSRKNEVSAFAKAKIGLGSMSIFADIQFRTMKLDISPDFGFMGIAPQSNVVREWTFVNPRLGVNYQVSDRLESYASFGRTGREPTRSDILGGFQLNASNLDLARSNAFKAEYVNDFEAGVRHKGEKVAINANVFYMDFENEIAPYGEIIAFGVQKRTNIKDSYRRGIEIDANYVPAEVLSIQGNVTYMQAEIKELEDEGTGDVYENVSPILTPEWTYSGSVTYAPLSDLSVSLTGRGISESFLEISNDERLTLPAYFVAGARVNASLAMFEFSFEVNNLFDKQYYTNGSPVDVDYDGTVDGPGYFINAGRNYFFTTRIKF